MKPIATVYTTTFHGRLEWLRDLLQAVKRFTPINRIKCIVVDNASRDGTREYLASQKWVSVIRNRRNLDCCMGGNQVLSVANTPYIINIDTDALVIGRGWLEASIDYMERNPKVGLAGNVWNPGFPVESSMYRRGWRPEKFGIDRLNHVQGGFMVIRKTLVDQIGKYNEVYPHNFMDVEYSYRALSFGWELGNLDWVADQVQAATAIGSPIKVMHPVRDDPVRDKVRQVLLKDNRHRYKPNKTNSLALRRDLKGWKSQADDLSANHGLHVTGLKTDGGITSIRRFRDIELDFELGELTGVAFAKLRLQSAEQTSSNSYHVAISADGSFYFARSNRVFSSMPPPGAPRAGTLKFKLQATGSQIRVYRNGSLVSRIVDYQLKDGHVYLGVLKGSAHFRRIKVTPLSTLQV